MKLKINKFKIPTGDRPKKTYSEKDVDSRKYKKKLTQKIGGKK